MTHGRADTIITSITSADDDDILALCIDVSAVLKVRVEERFRVHLEILRGKVDTVEVTSGDLEVARPSCASADYHCVVLGL
jgi:RNase P/RNase MRP subunit p30